MMYSWCRNQIITGKHSCYSNLFLHFWFPAKLPNRMVVSGAVDSCWINNDVSIWKALQFGTWTVYNDSVFHDWKSFKSWVSVWSSAGNTDWATGVALQCLVFLWGHPERAREWKIAIERDCIQTMVFSAAIPLNYETDKCRSRYVSTLLNKQIAKRSAIL